MVGLVGVGMEMVDRKHAGQSQGGWSHVGRCRGTSRVRGDTLMTPDHTTVQVCSYWVGSSRDWSVFLGRR